MDKSITVREIKFEGNPDIQQVSKLLDEYSESHQVDLINWEQFSYQPKVSFRIAHWNNYIWLKYAVEEENILAERTRTNDYVSKDSCVEFFFDPLGDGSYYNFEFNCIGTTHLAYGPQRKKRNYSAPEDIHELIQVQSSLGTEPFAEKTGGHQWEITIIIPAQSLGHNPGIQLKGLSSKANFYKCGDATSEKHYLSWNPVNTKKPDFHRPEFFGTLIFE
ncbi:MAG: carbohydrate-binding family 9-like protein [Bacteroidota bacterium]